MTKAVTFDFWNTLFTESPQAWAQLLPLRVSALQWGLEELGQSVPAADIEAAFLQSGELQSSAWEQERMYWPYQRVQAVLASFALQAPHDLLSEITRRLEDSSLQTQLTPLPGTLEALPMLAQHWPLGIVSDTGLSPGRVLRQHLERHGILACFSSFSFSDETGVVKPLPQAFEAALKPLGVSPAQAWHVGDIPRTDIAGAKRLGYAGAVLYTGKHLYGGQALPTHTVSSHLELLSLLKGAP